MIRVYKLLIYLGGITCCFTTVNAIDNKIIDNKTPMANEKIQKSDSLKKENEKEFTISLTAGNNLIQKGKKAATAIPYLNPLIGYSFESGIYINLSADYLLNTSKKPLDDISFEGGYLHSFGDHFSTTIGYTYKHFYSKKQVTFSEPNTVSLSASWNGNILTPSVSANYAFGQTKDITTDLDVEHSFDFEKIFTEDDALSIPLTIGASIGTSNFYKEYATYNVLKKKGGATVNPDEINTKFGLTSVSIGAGIAYTIKKLTITPAINYTMSKNSSANIDMKNVPDYTLELLLSF